MLQLYIESVCKGEQLYEYEKVTNLGLFPLDYVNDSKGVN